MKIPVLDSGEWNKLIDKLSRRLPLQFFSAGRTWAHPWTVSMQWVSSEEEHSPTKGEWRMHIKEGFVNGLDAEINTIADFATEVTLRRITEETGNRPEPKASVVARLTEKPSVAISAGMPRVIGKGSDASSVEVSDSGELNVEFEPIPSYFSQFNVEGAINLKGNLTTGIVEVAEIPVKDARRLRAFDIALYFDRPALKIDTSQRGVAALDGFTTLLNYTYGRSSPANKRPYLKVMSKYVPPLAGSVSLLDGAADPEFDSIKVATVYFLSGPGEDELATLDGTWVPMVKHNLFWNLAHGTARLLPPADNKPLTISTGLAAGLGDMIGNQILSPNNEAYAEALVQMKARTAEGRFWSI